MKYSPQKNKLFRSQSGMTLMEVLMGIFISVTVIMAAYSVYLVSTKSYTHGEQMSDMSQNGRIAIDRMTREIRQTNDIVPTGNPQAAFSNDPAHPSHEIEFQDGHKTNPVGDIQYLHYFISAGTSDLHRQRLYYFCPSAPSVHVNKLIDCNTATPLVIDPTTGSVMDDQIIAQNINGLNLYGQRLIDIGFNVVESGQSTKFETKVYGRNIP